MHPNGRRRRKKKGKEVSLERGEKGKGIDLTYLDYSEASAGGGKKGRLRKEREQKSATFIYPQPRCIF